MNTALNQFFMGGAFASVESITIVDDNAASLIIAKYQLEEANDDDQAAEALLCRSRRTPKRRSRRTRKPRFVTNLATIEEEPEKELMETALVDLIDQATPPQQRRSQRSLLSSPDSLSSKREASAVPRKSSTPSPRMKAQSLRLNKEGALAA